MHLRHNLFLLSLVTHSCSQRIPAILNLTMNSDLSCHPTSSAMLGSSGSINESVRDEKGSRETIGDARIYSDKVPLTSLHLCRYEDCHSSKPNSGRPSPSPLDPFKTRALYLLLSLTGIWLTIYIIFTYFKIL